MCEMAVEHAPDQRVWWNVSGLRFSMVTPVQTDPADPADPGLSHPQYLTLETTFEGKDYVCERLLQFLIAESSSGVTDELSFHLMEALFYRVELNLFTGRRESALAHFQVKKPRTVSGLE